MAATLARTWCRARLASNQKCKALQITTRCFTVTRMKADDGLFDRIKKFVFGENIENEPAQTDSYYDMIVSKPAVYSMKPEERKMKFDSIVSEHELHNKVLTDELTKYKGIKMGSMVSQMYKGVQYMIGCGGYSNKALPSPDTFHKANALVWKRTGSMYFDEDGDLAHEFYEEVKPKKKGGKAGMRPLKLDSLSPQGIVAYQVPRLHVDFPYVICETWTS